MLPGRERAKCVDKSEILAREDTLQRSKCVMFLERYVCIRIKEGPEARSKKVKIEACTV